MGSLAKSYHHYDGAECIARYPIKTGRDGVYIMGPITVIRDQFGNPEKDAKGNSKWNETKANDIFGGPFEDETEAVQAIKWKLRPRLQKAPKAKSAFEKWKAKMEAVDGGDEE